MKITRRRAVASLLGAGAAMALPRVTSASPVAAHWLSGLEDEVAQEHLDDLVALIDFEQAAIRRMDGKAREYIIGGAGDEITLRWNREAYDRLALRPRVLANLSRLDTRVSLFGTELPHPILLAPTAAHKLVHAEGELETARGATSAETAMVLSTMSTTAVEQVASACKRALWFQLYVQPDRGYTAELVKRAESAGCSALVITVDTPVAGARNRQERARFRFPETVAMPHLQPNGPTTRKSEREILDELLTSNLTWKDIEWLRTLTRLPVLIKGVLDPEDARIAVREKVAGLIVSNHGARNLDTVPATIDALPQVADAAQGETTVLVDGGIRRGTDVLKALALGADAVLIGRPYLFGLAVAGAAGVDRVVNILRHEFEMAMALCGRDSVKELDRSVLWS